MKQLLVSFYSAFKELDAETMASCYHPEIVFQDPAFGILKGERAKNMWRMLCESQKGKDFKITYSQIEADDQLGSASWEALYTFSKTGRKVHNKIRASFEFKDGKIIKHTDDFDFNKWSSQAFGVRGAILGRTKFFRNKLRHRVNRMLSKFEDQLAAKKLL
ncbi:nuclear transport factor 2 family protein [Geojedonia litorea]|uniref:Nuclear transport factor 2 family protein n=1 Tax=Geojedonia litorea TaxID=1268269 RepID=A0ABV9N5H5_9FLAO